MLGLGGQEILVLGILCVFPFLAGVVAFIMIVSSQSKKKKRNRDNTDE